MSAIRVQSSNPAFAGFEQVYGASRTNVMTLQGTVGKTFGLLGILTFLAVWSWNAMANHEIQFAVLPVAAIGGTVLAFMTIFKPTWAPWTAPVYAAFEGVFLGMFSYFVEHMIAMKAGHAHGTTGIALQAVTLTAATLFCMLFVYTTGIVRVTEKLKAGVIAATGGVALVYLVSIVMSLFGARVPFLNDATPIGIGISLVIVGIAAFNLLLDFDFVDQGVRAEAPKYMEWYAAFGLMLTLVWLYLEILRLLRKFQDRN